MSKSKGRRLSEWLRNLDSNSRAGSNTLADDSVGSDQLAHDLALQGNPTAATQSSGNNSTRLATTAFVATEVAALVDSAPGTLNTLNELAAALGDDANFSTTVTNSIATKAPLASPALTGTPTAPTASSGTNTTQVATTAFVTAATSGLATDANVANKAPINSPTFTGTPAAPTASAGTNTTQIATTAFVTTAVAAGGVAGISSSADATAITIDSSENVGIGATSPVSQLEVKGTAPVVTANSNVFAASGNGTGFGIYRSASGRTAGYTWTIENVIASGGSSGSHYQIDNLVFKNRASISDSSLTEQMRIDSSGNVGIGHSGSLVNKLTVNGNQVMLASGEMKFADAGNSLVSVIKNGGSSGTSQMQFLVGSTPAEVMRIDSSGNVGIGINSLVNPLQVGVTSNTTSKTSGSAFDGGAIRLDGNLGSAGSEVGILGGANDGLSSGIGFARQDGSTWGTQIRFYTHGTAITTTDELTERVRIDASGNVGIGNNNPTATLDVNGTVKLDGNYPVGTGNVALGNQALDAVTSGGNYNVAIGRMALTNCTSGDFNIAVGNRTLDGLTTASYNTAVGHAALLANTDGTYNTALGCYSQQDTTTGVGNTSAGYGSLNNNTTGAYNTAIGYTALYSQTSESHNTALGYAAGYSNTTGSLNMFLGNYAGYSNTTAGYSVCVGYYAGYNTTTNGYNAFLGYYAGSNGTGAGYGNVAIGFNSQVGTSSTTRTQSIVLGYQTLGVGSGYFTFGTGNGNSRVYNQFGANSSWTRVSDQRYKTDIQDNTNCGLAFINDLRPVTFKWKPKSEIDNTLPDYDADAATAEYSPKMYGLIAQEVKQVLDNHNITDFGGWHQEEDSGIQGISQEMFIYPLIKAVQELSAKVTALENGG